MRYRKIAVNVICNCGHEQEIMVWPGNTHDGDRVSYPCQSCEAEALRKEIEAFETENELPQLEGTEKQIEWARQTRHKFLQKLAALVEKELEVLTDEDKDHARDMLDYAMDIKSAAYWINNVALGDKIGAVQGGSPMGYRSKESKKPLFVVRSTQISQWWEATKKKTPEEIAALEEKAAAEREKRKVREPIEPPDEVLANETLYFNSDGEGKIVMDSKYDKTIVSFMHSIHAQWDGASWSVTYPAWACDAKDAVACVMHKALTYGIRTSTHNKDIKEMTINATFDPIPTRLIFVNGQDLEVTAPTDKLVNLVNGIKGVRHKRERNGYGPVHYLIAPKNFESIFDFADENGYKISPKAQELLESAREKVLPTVKTAPEEADTTKSREVIDYDALVEELRG